jgi:uncharacterized protein (TIGR01777 family)
MNSMPTTSLSFVSRVDAPADQVFAWHSRDGAFERLTPPWANVRVVESRGHIAPGDGKRLRLGIGPFGVPWSIVHQKSSHDPGFLDVQQQGPFSSWRHEHRFIHLDQRSTTLDDQVIYALPLGVAGNTVAGKKVEQRLEELFTFRHRRTRSDLYHHGRFQQAQPLRVAITGASGLIGTQLGHFLRSGGHEVYSLVRHKTSAPNDIHWNPATGEIEAAKLEGMDAVVHLAGVSIAGGRWTASRKRAILESRVQGTSLLATTLAGLNRPPGVLVSTSAIGFYGNSPGVLLTEDAPAGEGFLAGVCEDWETATLPASGAGIRVVIPRFGVVLSGSGGILPLIARAFRFGAGGPLGSGKQSMSWIALDDLLGVLLEAIRNPQLSGPVNAVAPDPVTNREFTATLARVLRRPAFFRVPASVLHLAAGELADELLLVDQAVEPSRLRDAHFRFGFNSLEDALRHELGRARGRGSLTMEKHAPGRSGETQVDV